MVKQGEDKSKQTQRQQITGQRYWEKWGHSLVSKPRSVAEQFYVVTCQPITVAIFDIPMGSGQTAQNFTGQKFTDSHLQQLTFKFI